MANRKAETIILISILFIFSILFAFFNIYWLISQNPVITFDAIMTISRVIMMFGVVFTIALFIYKRYKTGDYSKKKMPAIYNTLLTIFFIGIAVSVWLPMIFE